MTPTYLVVDDEPLARLRLQQVVAEVCPGARCAGEAEDGPSALRLLRQSPADLLFLDIEFPPEGAFGVLEAARREGLALPPLVFTTAYDQHALEAFRWAAVDYLLKPLSPERVKEAMARVQARTPDLDLLREAFAAKAKPPARFAVTTKEGWRVLAWADVTHVSTENRLVFVHTPEGRFLLDRTMADLEAMLGEAFLRCHRSALVNVACVKAVLPEAGELVLRDGARVPLSKDRLAEAKKVLWEG